MSLPLCVSVHPILYLKLELLSVNLKSKSGRCAAFMAGVMRYKNKKSYVKVCGIKLGLKSRVG